MDCPQVCDLLSPYHDDELSPADREQVRAHLATCPACALELRRFEQLSRIAARLEMPAVPSDVWREIAVRLGESADHTSRLAPARRRRVRVALAAAAVAALLLLSVTVAVVRFNRPAGHEGVFVAHKGVDLAPYASLFLREPQAAQDELLATYPHRRVAENARDESLPFRPALAPSIGDFRLRDVHVLDMPCCRCIQAVYSHDDRGMLATFQQSSDQPIAFAGCPRLTCICQGRETQLYAVNGGLAATWALGDTLLTLVGAPDLEHVIRTMTALEPVDAPLDAP